jgi:D-3-phosphoglycerate dehydrogenase
MHVLAYDPMLSEDQVRSMGAEPSTLSQLAKHCDAVSLHAPGDRQLIGNDWLKQAKPGMLLINTARAILVDEYALARELNTGQLGGYAADDLGPSEDGSAHPLLADHLKDRVILTPHCAAQTVEAVDNMGSGATAAVLAVLSGGTPPNIVAPNLESRPSSRPAAGNNREVTQ